ncbi:MAG TPA: DUF368 domain-containing protein [Gammaproteobacteria bacterium]|mgnify:CR=1 FL=1|nr:DUF368 domain-containing protein [Xanthomonadales bacterium]HPI96427.1 DUF368 domain-containing protein [Gammaproteobacteria bacterium]HPQ87219.1 DUF368 domain-containing protein [Gammaproteobacteria bacterium]
MFDKLLIAAKGVAMGAADVVPGVSGGTIALMTGIYPRLINAIASFDIECIKLFFSGRFKEFWKHIDGSFLLPLLLGILTAFALLAHTIKFAIANHPIPTWSFFFGLIIASSILIIQHIKHKKAAHFLWLIPGIAFGYWIGSMTSIPFPDNNSAVFVAGGIAICAMILPGISGSFILLLIGMYETLINAVANRNFAILAIFATGAVIGLLIFSRVIKLVLARFYEASVFFLSGLMLGSLVKVWPWKTETTNILPNLHPQPQTTLAITMMILAFVIVFGIDYLGRKLSVEKQTE